MALRIDEWRRVKNISQSEMAERLGIAASTYSYWENHLDSLKLSQIPPIAEALGVSIEEINLFLPSHRNLISTEEK